MNLFKDIAQTLGIALGIGLIVFCLVVLFDRNAGSINWNSRRDRIDNEAERVSENVDKYVRRGKKIYTKLKEMEDDETTPTTPKTTTATTNNTTTPKPTAPISQTPQPRPTPMSVANTTTDEGPFVIQVGRLSEKAPTIATFENIKKFGTLYVAPSGTDKKVILGTFTDRIKAETVLTQIRNMGYPDAFLSKEMPKAGTSKPLASTEKTTTTKTLLSPTTAPIISNNNSNKGGFVVQVVANKYPVLSTYKGLASFGKLYQEQDPATQLTKIMLGTYQDEETARQILQTVKKQGFENAFIKNVDGKTVNTWKRL